MPRRIRPAEWNSSVGRSGEKITEWHLKHEGFRTLERNFKTPFGEIDLVALDKETLVFIEVKTRVSADFGPPSLSITEKKERTMIKNAMYYIKRRRLYDIDARIDVVCINLDESGKFEKLEHLRSAIWIKEDENEK